MNGLHLNFLARYNGLKAHDYSGLLKACDEIHEFLLEPFIQQSKNSLGHMLASGKSELSEARFVHGFGLNFSVFFLIFASILPIIS
jgi:hypothetical protein